MFHLGTDHCELRVQLESGCLEPTRLGQKASAHLLQDPRCYACAVDAVCQGPWKMLLRSSLALCSGAGLHGIMWQQSFPEVVSIL